MKRFLAVLCLAACGPVEPSGPEEPLASREDAIVNGVGRNELTFGGGLVEATGVACTGVFVATDLVLTHARCKGVARVWVAGQRYGVRLVRQTPNTLVVVVQLHRQVPGVFVWRLTAQRVTNTDVLTCFGYDQQRVFTSGLFRVSDLGAELISLRGGQAGPGVFGVEETDDGGFCMRDTTFELVAILASSRGTPRAVQAEPLADWLVDILVAADQARRQTSVSLVHHPAAPTPLTLTATGTTGIQTQPRSPGAPRQGFYLAPVVSGRPEVVALVNAETGRCVSVSPGIGALPGTASQARCNFAASSQWFVMTSRPDAFTGNLTTGYRLESPSTPGECLTPSSGFLLQPRSLRAAEFGLWLNLF